MSASSFGRRPSSRAGGGKRRLVAAALVAAGLLPAVAAAADGSWNNVNGGNWSDTASWTGGVVADGIGSTATFATPNLTQLTIVTLDTNRTIGNVTFGNPTNTFGWLLDGFSTLTMQVSSGTPTISVTNPFVTAQVNPVLGGTQGLAVTGPGTLTFANASTYTGATTVTRGTLNLDSSIQSQATILPFNTDLILAGGTVNVIGAPSVPVNAAFNSLTVNPGTGIITATAGNGGTTAVGVGGITRNVGGILQFGAGQSGVTGTSSSTNTAGDILGGWATLFLLPVNNGQTQTGSSTTWATVVGGQIAPYPVAAAGQTGYLTAGAWTAGRNTDETTNGTVSIAANATTNSIRFNNSSAAGYTTNLAGGTNTITSGGILVTQGVNGVTATAIGGAGLLTSGPGVPDLIVQQYNRFNTFTIAAGITGSIGLTTGGTGTTNISGPNNYTGPTTVAGGTLLVQSPAALPTLGTAGQTVVTGNGTLAVNTGGWTAANVDTLAANGTFQPGAALGFDVPAAANFPYATAIGGGLGVTKSNAGTLTLTGTSSYTGATTVKGGTLSVGTVAANGTNSPLGAGNTLVLTTGGTLQYTGGTATLNRSVQLPLDGGGVAVSTAASNLTLSGAVFGPGGLTVTGPGTVTLSGTNSYLGPTVVNSGTVVFSTAGSLPAGAELTIASGATAQLPAGATQTLAAVNGAGTLALPAAATTLNLGSDTASGVFQGTIANGSAARALVKNGAGIQVLAGANTFTGGTTINAGTVQLSPQSAAANPLGTGAVTLATPGVTLAYRQTLPIAASGYNQDVVWDIREGTNVAQGVTFPFDGGQTFYGPNMPGAPAIAGGMPAGRGTNAVGAGLNGVAGTNAPIFGGGSPNGSTFVLQPYTAANSLNLRGQQSGTLTLGSPAAFKTVSVLAAAGNGNTTFNATFNYADGTSTLLTAVDPDWFTGIPYVIGGVGRYNTSNNVFDTGAPGAANPRLFQINFSLPAADQGKTLNSITFQNAAAATAGNIVNIFALNGTATAAPSVLTPGNNVTVNGDANLEVSGYTSVAMGALSLAGGSLTVPGTAGSTMTFTGTTLQSAQTVTVPTAGVTLGLGNVTDNNGSFGLTKAGAGTLTITNGTAYAGGTVTVSGGTLLVNQPSGLPGRTTPGAVVVASGATVAVSYGTAGPQWTEADVNTLLTNASGFAAGSFLGFDVASGSPTFGGTIAGVLGVAKSNAGTLTLTGANTYTGPTAVNGGILSVSSLANGLSASNIGQSSNAAANLTFSNGGILQYTGPTASTDRAFTVTIGTGGSGGGFDVTQAGTALTVSGAGTGNGQLLKNGPGTLILTGANTYAGGTTINAGTLQVGAAGTTGALGPGAVSILGTGTLAYNLTNAATVPSAITGAGSGGVVQLGTGTLTLSGGNTYTGPTTVSAGTLAAGSPSAFGVNSAVTTATGGTLSVNGRNVAVGSLAGTGGTVNNNTATPATLTVGGNNASTTYGGTIVDGSTGALALTKVGTGTLTLTGTNTYSGGTTINAGAVSVPTDAALGTGPVTIGSAFATLNYTGTTATARAFALGGSTLAVAAGQTVTLNGSVVSNGYLGGAGTFATGTAGGTQFGSVTTLPSVTVTSNGPADQFVNFTNGGALTVAPGLSAPVAFNGFTNQPSGRVTVGAASGTGTTVNAANFQSSGTLTIPNAPGGFAAANKLVNTGAAPLSFNGGSRTFLGTPATAGQLGAIIDLNGKSATVAGGLLVNNGLVYDSTNGGSATLIADFGALVKGAGTYGVPVVTVNGGRFQAGNSPGKAEFGAFAFGPGGVDNYVLAMNDADGTAGPTPDADGHVSGWGLVKAVRQVGGLATSGDFAWAADPAHKLVVALQTLVNPTTAGADAPGPMADFDPMKSYSWPAVTWTGTYTGPTDVAALDAATTFDATGFANATNGGSFGWALDAGGHTLSLTFTPVPEPGTLALLGAAAGGLGWAIRRRRRDAK
ncbi:MAG TPA: autotransporter-associated beta strand repeat-containing protein [Gemmataceae bacterium]|jgi:autotransporter-associated beta strand protein